MPSSVSPPLSFVVGCGHSYKAQCFHDLRLENLGRIGCLINERLSIKDYLRIT